MWRKAFTEFTFYIYFAIGKVLIFVGPEAKCLQTMVFVI